MLIVSSGYKLRTAAPSSHEYRFQSVPTPVQHEISSPCNVDQYRPVMISNMNETLILCDYYDHDTDPSTDDCTAASFSFQMLRDAPTVHSLTSIRDGNVYYPYIDGTIKRSYRESADPLKFCVFTSTNSGHVNSDGSVYYTTSSPFVAVVGTDSLGEEWFIQRDNSLLNNFTDIILVPQSKAQQDRIYTVSGGE